MTVETTPQSIISNPFTVTEPLKEALGLYAKLLRSWNERNADDFANLFPENGTSVGFDGSQLDGQKTIRTSLAEIFRSYPTASYVAIVREVRLLTPTVALIRAVAGMIPRDDTKVNPSVNAVQTLIATVDTGALEQAEWKISHFQNTPAALHGRPDLVRILTEELNTLAEKVR